MLDLARRTVELLVARIEDLPAANAWDGEFKQALDHHLMAAPPPPALTPCPD